MTESKSNIWLITGPREVGKTRFCSHLVAEAQIMDLNVSGLLCPPKYQDKQKLAIEIEDLSTGEHYTLAKARKAADEGLMTNRWVFNLEVMNWGNDVLQKAVPCDVLIVDELGPLEFKRGEGWQKGLAAIDSGQYKVAAVIVRPELISIALERWPHARVLEIPATLDDKTGAKLRNQVLSFD